MIEEFKYKGRKLTIEHHMLIEWQYVGRVDGSVEVYGNSVAQVRECLKTWVTYAK